jgi:hypothetical protein
MVNLLEDWASGNGLSILKTSVLVHGGNAISIKHVSWKTPRKEKI